MLQFLLVSLLDGTHGNNILEYLGQKLPHNTYTIIIGITCEVPLYDCMTKLIHISRIKIALQNMTFIAVIKQKGMYICGYYI